MTFRNPPPIEKLSDISWQRIERDLFRKLEKEPPVKAAPPAPNRRRAFTIAASALATAAAGVAIWLLVSNGPNPAPDSELSRLVTASSPSSITVGDASITAAPHTAVLVGYGESAGAQLVLERGAVHCAVPPRHGRKPFVVVAGEVRVEVVGTIFSVERIGDSARVVTERGVVKVTEAGVVHHVAAGESWPAETAAASKPEPRENVAAEPKPEPVTEAAPSRPHRARSKPEVRHPAQPEATPAEPTPKERYAAAARLESSDPAAALAIYRRLVREGGPWAANALFAQGRLELDRGNKARARSLLERYLRRYPSGLNARDARSLLRQLP